MARNSFSLVKRYSFAGYQILMMQAMLQVAILDSCYGLYCWKCISESCHLHPTIASQAVKVGCKEGQSCVKALYQMGQYTPRYPSVIRTCSAGSCVPMMEDEFRNCSSNPRRYNVTGCALRLCCNDRDFCNGTSRKKSTVIDIGQFALFLGLIVLS